MKFIRRRLIRLYPGNWQKRYGAELDALLDDAKPSALDLLDLLLGAVKMQLMTWSLSRAALISCATGLITMGVVAFTSPARYISEASLVLTPPSVYTRAFQQATIRDLRGRDLLTSLLQQNDLYSRERAHRSMNEIVDRVVDSIQVIPGHFSHSTSLAGEKSEIEAFDFLNVQYTDSDPRVAQRMSTALTDRVMSAALLDHELKSGSTAVLRVPDSLPNFIVSVWRQPTFPRLPEPEPIPWARAVDAGIIAALLAAAIVAAFATGRLLLLRLRHISCAPSDAAS